MQRRQAIFVGEFRGELCRRNHCLLICARLRDHDLRRPARHRLLQQTAVFHHEVHYRGRHLDILRAPVTLRRR